MSNFTDGLRNGADYIDKGKFYEIKYKIYAILRHV